MVTFTVCMLKDTNSKIQTWDFSSAEQRSHPKYHQTEFHAVFDSVLSSGGPLVGPLFVGAPVRLLAKHAEHA